MTITAELADGRKLEFPEGTAPEVVQATVKRVIASKPADQPKEPFVPSGEKTPKWTDPDVIAGNPVTRFALGAASPILGIQQQAEKGPTLPGPLGILGLVAKLGGGSPNLKELEALKESGRKKLGSEGFDFTEGAGSVLGPGSLATAKIAPAATALGRVGQGAAIGTGFGATTPVTHGDDGNFTRDKALQAVIGAALGSAISGGIETVKGVGKGIYNAIEPTFESGRAAILKRFQEGLFGNDPTTKAKIIAALENAPEIVRGSKPTAAEAMSEIPQATGLAAHEKIISKSSGLSPEFVARDQAQAGARQGALATVGQDRAALDAAVKNRASNASEGYGAVRGDRISPQSEAEIMQEAIANRAASKAEALRDQGRFATTAAQQDVRAGNFVPVPGQPRVAGRLSENAQRVPEAQAAAGDAKAIAVQRAKEEQFLESTMDLLKKTVGLEDRSMSGLMNRPSMRAAVGDAIQSAAETGSYFPREAGEKFSVQNLQRIKESLDAGIRASKTAADAGKRPELSPAELEGTKNAFVQWLSSRSPGWKQARLQYAEDSRPINQMEVGQYLGDKLQSATGAERAASFAQAVRDAPGTIKRSTGQPRFQDLGEVLTPQQEAVVNAVLADVQRSVRADKLAGGTNLTGSTNIAQRNEGSPLPNLLSRTAMIANFVMKKMGHGADTKINSAAAEQYLNPQKLADALKDLPQSQRAAVVQAIIQQSRNPLTIGAPATSAAKQY